MSNHTTTEVADREQLDSMLVDLIDRGIEPAVYVEATGSVGLLAPYGEDGEWDAFDSHPYSCDGDPTGIARQFDLEESVDDGDLALVGEGFGDDAIVLAVSDHVAHPGLDSLRFPVVVMHEAR